MAQAWLIAIVAFAVPVAAWNAWETRRLHNRLKVLREANLGPIVRMTSLLERVSAQNEIMRHHMASGEDPRAVRQKEESKTP